jgi:hypothetical protein
MSGEATFYPYLTGNKYLNNRSLESRTQKGLAGEDIEVE